MVSSDPNSFFPVDSSIESWIDAICGVRISSLIDYAGK